MDNSRVLIKIKDLLEPDQINIIDTKLKKTENAYDSIDFILAKENKKPRAKQLLEIAEKQKTIIFFKDL